MKKSLLIFCLLLACSRAETLSVKAGEDYRLPVNSVARYLNNNKTVLAVRQPDRNTLLLTGIKAGKAYVYYWDMDNNPYVLKVQVLYNPQKEKSLAVKTNGRFEVYFKFDPVNDTPVNKRMVNEKFYYQTNLGGCNLSLFLENKNIGKTKSANIEQLGQFKLSISKGNNFLVLGDEVIQYTPLVGEYLTIQGAHTKVWLGDVSFDIFGGKKPGEYWGNEVLDYATRDKSHNDFTGGRITARLINNIAIGVTSIKQETRDIDDKKVLSTAVSAVDTTFKLNEYSINLETAKSEEISKNVGQAQQYQVNYDGDNSGFSLTYRNIGADYVPVADFFNYQGTRGYFFHGRYNPQTNIGLSGYYENYLKNFDQTIYTVYNNEYTAERSRVNFNIYQIPFCRPAFSIYQNLRINSKDNINALYSGYSLFLDQIELVSKGFLTSYLEYSPVRFSDAQNNLSNYNGSITKLGLRSKLNNWTMLRVEHTGEVYYYTEAQDTYDPHGYNFVLYFGKFAIPATTINFDFSYWFQNRKNSQETLDNNRSSVKLSFSQNLTPEFYWYLNGVAAQENSLKYEYEKREGYFYNHELIQSEVSGGGIYSF